MHNLPQQAGAQPHRAQPVAAGPSKAPASGNRCRGAPGLGAPLPSYNHSSDVMGRMRAEAVTLRGLQNQGRSTQLPECEPYGGKARYSLLTTAPLGGLSQPQLWPS